MSGGGRLILDTVQVQPTGGDGILVTYMVGGRWNNVKVGGARGHGIHFNKGMSPAAVAANIYTGIQVDSTQNANRAIYYEAGGNDDVWFQVTIESNTGAGIYIDTTDVTMYGVHEESSTGNGIEFATTNANRNTIHTGLFSGVVVDASTGGNNIVTGYDNTNLRGHRFFLLGNQPRIDLRSITGASTVSFLADTTGIFTLSRSTVPHLSLSSTESVFNEDGEDRDLRVEGDTVTNLFVVDARNETVAIGGGAGIKKHLSGTASLDFDLSGAGITCQDLTVTVTGAADGDVVAIGPVNALASTAGVTMSGFVSAANTVTVRACDVTSGNPNPAAATVRADVWAH